MKQLTSGHVKALADALADAFPAVNRLDELLHDDSLGKKFDELTSRFVSLRDNAWDIASAAIDQGWGSELLAAALVVQKDNPKLRALAASLPEGDDQVPIDDGLDDRPSLKCGRAVQWNEISQCAPARQHQVILVAGAAGQEPVHFRDRIHTWLDTRPPRSILLVDWPSRPASRDAFVEALGKALEVPTTMVGRALADRLSAANLVLLHDCVKLRFNDDALVRSYTVWLPELLADLPHASKLKCVQPIEWPLSEKSLWAKLFADEAADANGEDGARGLLARLSEKASGQMPVISLTELVNLTEDEVTSFIRLSDLTARQKTLMLEHVKAALPLPARIFETIDAYWSHVEAAS